MDFSDKELKVVLQALYRFRGEVSGASQAEQNRFGAVESVIGKIEKEVGPLKAEKTGFDREMEESLSVLKTGRVSARAGAKADTPKKDGKAKVAVDKASAAPKVKKVIGASKAVAAARKAK
jgi:hypothetical protein